MKYIWTGEKDSNFKDPANYIRRNKGTKRAGINTCCWDCSKYRSCRFAKCKAKKNSAVCHYKQNKDECGYTWCLVCVGFKQKEK